MSYMLSSKMQFFAKWKFLSCINPRLLIEEDAPFQHSNLPLVLAGSGLARLELVKVPAANGQVALVLVHAAPEVADILCANAGSLVLGVHGGLAVLGLGERLVGRRSCAGPAAEPAADGVADGGTDSDTTRCHVSFRGSNGSACLWQLTQQCWPSGRKDRYRRSLRVQPVEERRQQEEERAGWQEAERRCWPGEPGQAAEAQSETEE